MRTRAPGQTVRESLQHDLPSLAALYPAAFPDEDLLPLVRALLDGSHDVLSLVARAEGMVVGHALFTICDIAGSGARAALLGPVAVAPARQRRGIGGALIRDGLRRLEAAGVVRVFVLGAPAYYSRFGFALDDTVAPPYDLPPRWRGAWQSIGMGGAGAGVPGTIRGTLAVPEPWRQPALWGP